ncbi:MAG: two-component system sensor histidine kinase/response regulator [Lentisphaeria bacterium]|jgi:two-component system sensor histidine kinase/response regulator
MVKRIYSNYSVKVLVVDDSRLARRTIERMLHTQRFIVFSASSGVEALDILKDHPDIRLAILDCYMEGMDEFELSRVMRETHSRQSLEILGISSQGGRNLSAQFIKSGANDFILKPFLPEEFLCRVNQSIDRLENFDALEKLNLLKNEFLGTAAHDIRGPIGAIKTAADYLLKRSPTPERTEFLLSMIQSSSVELLSLLETLLDVSVIESGVVQLSRRDTSISELV